MSAKSSTQSRGQEPKVRSLVRGLEILRLLNVEGGLSNARVAAETGLNRITAYRLLQTLQAEGCVLRDDAKRYRLAPGVLELSSLYPRQNWILKVAAPILEDLSRELGWPLILATNNGPFMVIQHTTRDNVGFWLKLQGPGSRLPLLDSALGFAFLARAAQPLRGDLINAALKVEDGASVELRRDRKKVYDLLDKVHRDGYATLRDSWESEAVPLSAIAVPVSGAGDTVAALGLTYYQAALTNGEAIGRFAAPLRQAAERIARAS